MLAKCIFGTKMHFVSLCHRLFYVSTGWARPRGTLGRNFWTPRGWGGPPIPPPLGGGSKSVPGNFFWPKNGSCCRENWIFGRRRRPKKILRLFFDQKKNMQGNFDQNRGVGDPPPSPQKGALKLKVTRVQQFLLGYTPCPQPPPSLSHLVTANSVV